MQSSTYKIRQIPNDGNKLQKMSTKYSTSKTDTVHDLGLLHFPGKKNHPECYSVTLLHFLKPKSKSPGHALFNNYTIDAVFYDGPTFVPHIREYGNFSVIDFIAE